MDFYTVWLIIPSIFGVACTAYQFQTGEFITLWSFGFSVLMSFWVTLFQERWKRKQNELRLQWGILLADPKDDDQIQPQFKGNECFSMLNHKVNLKEISNEGLLYRVLNVFIIIAFISISLYSFFTVKENMGSLAGVVNGMIIGAVNWIYRKVTVALIIKENHKLQELFTQAISLRLFFFQFVNANIGIFSTIYQTQNL